MAETPGAGLSVVRRSYTFLINFCNPGGTVLYPKGFEDPNGECPPGTTGTCEATKDPDSGQPTSVRVLRPTAGHGSGEDPWLCAHCPVAGVRELRNAAGDVVGRARAREHRAWADPHNDRG